MKVTKIGGGMFDSNAWLIENEGECLLVDAGVSAAQVARVVEGKGLRLIGVVLTHGHLDHVCQAGAICERLGAPLMLHAAELALYRDDRLNGFANFGMAVHAPLPEPDRLLSDGETLEAGGAQIRVIHTPGHTSGGICLLAGDWLIAGDTLFKTSVGRTDLPTGDMDTLLSSIREKLFVLPPQTIVCPGHGPESTIDFERKFNPYVRTAH